MGVDVIDLVRPDRSAGERSLHRHRQSLALWIGLGDMESVTGRGVAREFTVDPRPASLRVLQRFEHQHAGALAHDETIAPAVKRAASRLRGVVARAHRLHRAKTRIRKRRDGCFAPPSDHHISISAPNRVSRLSQRVGPGRTRRDNAEIRAARTILDGDQPRAHVTNERGYRER